MPGLPYGFESPIGTFGASVNKPCGEPGPAGHGLFGPKKSGQLVHGFVSYGAML